MNLATIRKSSVFLMLTMAFVLLLSALLFIASLLIFGSAERGFAYLRGTELAVANPIFTFGAIQSDVPHVVEFEFTNHTSQPVKLVGFESSCSCSSIKDLPLTIAPNGTSKLPVQIVRKIGQNDPVDIRVFTDLRSRPKVNLKIFATPVISNHQND